MAPAALLSNAELACVANAIETLSPKLGAEYSALRIEQARASGDEAMRVQRKGQVGTAVLTLPTYLQVGTAALTLPTYLQ